MNANREQLHELIDIVDVSEFDVIYHLLTKFIQEDTPTPDEVRAIRAGRESFERGEFVRHEDVPWN